MSDSKECPGMSRKEYDDYQSRSVRLKFLGQLTAGLAGASFLATLGTIAQTLMASHAAMLAAVAKGAVVGAAALDWPIVIGMAVVGILCTYLSCRYYQKAQILDTDFSAKKIAAASGRSPQSPETEIAATLEPDAGKDKAKPFAPIISSSGVATLSGDGLKETESPGEKWADKFAAAPATSAIAAVDAEKSWAQKLAAKVAANENETVLAKGA